MSDATHTSARTYLFVWIGVMALAALSLALSFARLGAWSPVVSIGIGLVKAALIAAFFMHLAEQPSVSRWAFALGIGLAILLLVMVAADVLTRQVPLLPPVRAT
jgi:cytochrome c oxidase subunit 4